jgi:predicted TIM-barrel fold metal-dependent hydrolase
VVAHFAGHRCIDLMMLMKRTPNLWADLSYSLLYYRGSSVVQDLLYASRSLRCERVLYGSDAPDRPVKESLVAARALFDEYGLDEGEQRRLLHLNARELLGWTDG